MIAIFLTVSWDSKTVAWLANTANINLFVFLPIMSMIIDYFGVRPTAIMGSAATTLCCLYTIHLLTEFELHVIFFSREDVFIKFVS
jgi:MFS family permease